MKRRARAFDGTGESPNLSADDRLRSLDAAMARQGLRQDALIEVLHSAQGLFGSLNVELLGYIAHCLRLPPSRVYGVATFYHLFTLRPRGEHSCVVCTGTACHVNGAGAVLEAIGRSLGGDERGSTSEGRVTLETARCLGSCGIAPVVVFDGEVRGKQSPGSALERLGGWTADDRR